MKKSTIKILSLALAVVMVCFVFTACGKKLKGEYTSEISIAGVTISETTYEFSGKNVALTITAGGSSVSFEGTYEIDDDKITFTFEGDGAAEYSNTVAFEETDDGIKIAGVEYKKK